MIKEDIKDALEEFRIEKESRERNAEIIETYGCLLGCAYLLLRFVLLAIGTVLIFVIVFSIFEFLKY